MTPEEEALARRRRARNWALLGFLLAMVAVFYAVTLARLGGG